MHNTAVNAGEELSSRVTAFLSQPCYSGANTENSHTAQKLCKCRKDLHSLPEAAAAHIIAEGNIGFY